MNDIEKILRERGPLRSSAVAQELQARFGISGDAARKRLQRAPKEVLRFPIKLLPKGEEFLYLKEQRSEERFWTTFHAALRESGAVYACAIDGLVSRGGIIPVKDFSVICGAPLKMTKQISVSRLLENMQAAGIVRCVNYADLGECVQIERNEFGFPDYAGLKLRRTAEKILLESIREWVRNLGFGSYDSVSIRGDENEQPVGPFTWDLTAPSYLQPIIRSGGKPGFIVADVFVNVTLTEFDIRYFLRKAELTRAAIGSCVLPILVAESFSSDAIRAGKSVGVMLATPRNLFGARVANALQMLLSTLNNAAAVASANPEKLAKLIDSLADIEGASGTLRGILFELIVAHLAKNSAASIDFSVEARDPLSGKKADIDVLQIVNKSECVAIECKGKEPGGQVSIEEVEDWLRRIPIFNSYLAAHDRLREASRKFELWTSGEFSVDALHLLEKEKSARSKHPIGWKDGHDVRQLALVGKEKAMRIALDEHFLRHPLSQSKQPKKLAN